MRAALLPTPGEPFMLAYWLRNFETWRDEVDEVLVLVNGGDDNSRRMVIDAGGKAAIVPGPVGHGPALRWLLEHSTADDVVLCEDDAYVRTPGSIRAAFDRMVEVDVIGSPRYEDTRDIAIEEEWAEPDGTLQDVSRALWPAFLFAHRGDLLATDRVFGDRIFHLGETVPGIGPVTPEMCEYVGVSPDYIHIDTFYATTYQLRTKRIELVHRVRVLQAEAVEDWLRYEPPWFHVSGLGAIGYVLAGQTTNLPDYGPGGGLWPRRIAWWERTYRDAPEGMRESSYGHRYRASLDHFRQQTDIPAADVEAWDARLEPWVTW